jgi:hypothetical protein
MDESNAWSNKVGVGFNKILNHKQKILPYFVIISEKMSNTKSYRNMYRPIHKWSITWKGPLLQTVSSHHVNKIKVKNRNYKDYALLCYSVRSFVEEDRCFRGANCLHDSPSPWWCRQYAPLKHRSTSTRLRALYPRRVSSSFCRRKNLKF